MNKQLKVLFVGEAIYVSQTVLKGWNDFHLGSYVEHGGYFIQALKNAGIDVTYLPTLRVQEEFPWKIEELRKYDALAVSDVSSDSFNLSAQCMEGIRVPNRLKLIQQYVEEGGGYVMWGGYMSFTGLNGKGFYRNTPIAKILPVEMQVADDRQETPEGIVPFIKTPDHPILQDMPKKWEGWFMSYNRLIAKEGAEVLGVFEEYDNDPWIVCGTYGKGRTVASAVDCAHHGAAPSFLKWEGSAKLFSNVMKWVAKDI